MQAQIKHIDRSMSYLHKHNLPCKVNSLSGTPEYPVSNVG